MDQITNRLSLIYAQRSLAWSMLKFCTDDCIMIVNLIGKQCTSPLPVDSSPLDAFRKALETTPSLDRKALLCKAITEEAQLRADLMWRCMRVESLRVGGESLYNLLGESKKLALQGKFQQADSLMIIKLIATSKHKQTLFILKFEVERLIQAIAHAIKVDKAAIQIRRLRSVALRVIELAAWTFRALGQAALALAVLWVNLQINVLKPQTITDYLNQSSPLFSQLYFQRKVLDQGPQLPSINSKEQKVVLRQDVKGMLIQCKDVQSKQALLDQLGCFLGTSQSFKASSFESVIFQRKWGSQKNSQFMRELIRQVLTVQTWTVHPQDMEHDSGLQALLQAVLSQGAYLDSVKRQQVNYAVFMTCRKKTEHLALFERDLRVEWSLEGE